MALLNCKKCNKQFKNRPETLYCSKECRYNLRAEIECAECGKKTKNPKFCSSSCSAKTTNKNRAEFVKCLHCDTEFQKHRASAGKFCSRQCYYKNKAEERKATYKPWLNGKIGIGESCESGNSKGQLKDRFRQALLEHRGCACEKCGWSEINKYTNKYPLHVHHKDNDWSNNHVSNLQVLCPNCHSLTEKFGSRNIGNGRVDRRVKW